MLRKLLLFLAIACALVLVAAWLVAGYYRKEIIQQINTQLSARLNGRVEMADADLAFWATFPEVSLRLEGVKLTGLDSTQRPLLRAERIYISIDFMALLRRQVRFQSLHISEATISIWRGSNGITNVQGLMKRDTMERAKTPAGGVTLLADGLLHLEQVDVRYVDSVRHKSFGVLVKKGHSQFRGTDSLWHQKLVGDVFFHELILNPRKGTFLHETPAQLSLHAVHPRNSHVFYFDSSTLQLEKSLLTLRGSLHAPDSGRLKLNISSESLDYQEALRILPNGLATHLDDIQVARPFSYAIAIDAPIGIAAYPVVMMKFDFADNDVRSGPLHFENVSAHGTFTNRADSLMEPGDANTEITLTHLKATHNGLPFAGEARLHDLEALQLLLTAEHTFSLPVLNKLVDTTQVRLQKGNFHSRFRYEGTLSEYLDTAAVSYYGQLTGALEVTDAEIHWLPRQLVFKDVQTQVRFTQDSVWLDLLRATTGSNQLQLSGLVGNYVPFFTVPTEKAFVKLTVQSPDIDLTGLLGTRQVAKKKTTARARQAARQRVTDWVEEVFNTLEVQVQLNIGHVKRGSFETRQLKGELKVGQNKLEANRMTMQFAGGALDASFLMKDLDASEHPIYLTAYTKNVNLKSLFRAFDNFHQQKITHKNLEGTVSTSVKLGARVNQDFEFVPGSFWGPVRATVKKGTLHDLPAFQSLSNFLLKRRDFAEVKFAQIESRFYIKSREIEIERMEIQSSVLGLFVEGVYSLRNKTDLLVQIPLSNLKKRDKKFVPEKVGTDAKVGPSVFLRAKENEDGKIEIKYELLHRFKKKR